MAVIPINLARVSHNLRAFNLLETVRRNQTDLFRVQTQLATGQEVLQPSDDPTRAAVVSAVDRRLDLIEQVERNLLHVNSALVAGESAMKDAVELLMEARTLASEGVSDTNASDQRAALAPLVDSLLDQLVAVGNRPYLNTCLFSGHYGAGMPFELTGDGVIYYGDDGEARSIVDTDLTQDNFTLSGAEFFAAVSAAMRGTVDLDPTLTAETRISELRGTTGQGVSLGQILVSDGSNDVQIDLSGADTVGDLLDKLNAEMPASLEAALDGQGILISSTLGGPVQITIRDLSGSQAARDLGISADGLALAVGGADLDPELTLRTRLTDLNDGAGLDTAGGLIIRNGGREATLDFAAAETVEDVLNIVNHAGVGVWARLADDGRTVEILNRVSGSDLFIGENGGQLATDLGVRSLHADSELASLNDGRGVATVEGDDLRFVTADGTVVEVDVDGAETFQDVIDLINAGGGGALTAEMAAQGNGLVITDNTVGPGTLRIERANLSPALDGLGLDVSAMGGRLAGEDVNPIRTNSAFTALVELRDALRRDDRQAIAWAGARVEETLTRMQEVQGSMASHAQAMEARSRLVENEASGAQVLLSDVRDVDLAEALVRFQQMQVALQANLSTSSRVMNLSLIDYLR